MLLFLIEDQGVVRPGVATPPRFWITPGGGLEPGESFAAAACRELREETGIVAAKLGPVVAVGDAVLLWGGEPIRSRERFYLVPVDGAAVCLDGLDAGERAVYRDHRWWRPADLRASGEFVGPPGLLDLLGRIVAGDLPSPPVRLA